MLRVGDQVVAREDSHVFGERDRSVPAGSVGVVLARHGLRSVSVRYGNGVELFQPVRKVRPLAKSRPEPPR